MGEGILDLASIRNDNDMVAGFRVNGSVFSTTIDSQEGDIAVQLPALDLHFKMLNGKTEHRVSITPDLVIPLIANLASWQLQLNTMQQGAPPPAPPEGRGPGA